MIAHAMDGLVTHRNKMSDQRAHQLSCKQTLLCLSSSEPFAAVRTLKKLFP